MSHKTTLAAISAVAILALMAICCIIPASDAESTTIDSDLGEKWGWRIQFIFDGKDAEGVEWDFGDGSPVSTDWNPLHTFPRVSGRSYTVTQIAWNHYGLTDEQKNNGERVESVAHYRITIMGDPVVKFDTGSGSKIEDLEVKTGNTIAAPKDPVWEGHKFTGWYKDPEGKQKWDFNKDTVSKSITLYAVWDGKVTAGNTSEVSAASAFNWVEDHAAFSVVGALAAIALIAGAITRNPRIIFLAVILAIVAAGILYLPDLGVKI